MERSGLSRSFKHFDLIHNLLDSVDVSHSDLGQLLMEEARQPTSQHQNALVIKAEYFPNRWVRASLKAALGKRFDRKWH
jgi:hypothetical protein